jgi:hypothetical protein
MIASNRRQHARRSAAKRKEDAGMMITGTRCATVPKDGSETGSRGLLSAARRCAFVGAWLLATMAALAEPSSAPATKTEPPVSSTQRMSSPPAMKPDVPPTSSGPRPTASEPEKKGRAAGPPLDLAALEQRLRETDAIGFFTKLTLKNQVNDLLDRFRSFYAGRLKVPLAEMRQPYDLLLMKTIAVVQDGDPALATEIASSRDPIWEMLADRDKFAALAAGL